MATFSVNQVRQLYVAKAVKDAPVLSTDTAGTAAIKADSAKTHLYIQYKGADNLTRSDLVNIKDILDVKVTDASAMSKALKTVTVNLDSTINSGAPVTGQDYILRVSFRQYLGPSDEDQYFKYGLVHAYSGMTASDFYKTLALSLVKNFSKELVPLVTFQLTTATTPITVDTTTKASALTGTYTGVTITEAPQEWVRGIKAQVPVYFEAYPTTITYQGDEVTWGITVLGTTGLIKNGKKIADLEYFCMGERGDIYRNVSFPNSIPTTYLVDPTLEYNVVDIHYAYTGGNEAVQKSEKDITVVIPKVGAILADANALTNTFITALNTASGLSIATLPIA